MTYLLDRCWIEAARAEEQGARSIVDKRLEAESDHFGYTKGTGGHIRDIVAVPEGYELLTMLGTGSPDGPLVSHHFGWSRGIGRSQPPSAKLSGVLAKSLLGLDDELAARLASDFGAPIRAGNITSVPAAYRKTFPEMAKRRQEASVWRADSTEVRLERHDQPMVGGYSWYMVRLTYVAIAKSHHSNVWQSAVASP